MSNVATLFTSPLTYFGFGEQHGVDAVTIICEQVKMRRGAYGWVDGNAPGIPRQLDDDP